MTLDYWDMEDDLDEELYSMLGYFIIQFSGAELALAALLAIVSGVSDLEVFHSLAGGLDAKGKVLKLREIANRNQKRRIQKNGALDARLIYFYDKSVELRNRLAHSWLVQAKGLPQTLLISNIGRLPFKAFKMERQHGGDPERITLEALGEHAEWLHYFMVDISSLMKPAKTGQLLEITKPRSLEPKELQKRLERIERRASEHTRKQTPLKKSQ